MAEEKTKLRIFTIFLQERGRDIFYACRLSKQQFNRPLLYQKRQPTFIQTFKIDFKKKFSHQKIIYRSLDQRKNSQI